MSRKDSKGLFQNVLGQLNNEPPAVENTQRTSSPHLLSVAAGVRQIQERGELADKLLKNGENVVELDPDQVLPSAIPDRFDGAYEQENLQDLMQSMKLHGQSTPGLVRPAPGIPGKFQIVFGRRRMVAAKLLGLKFKALVKELSDEQAIVLQGEENTNRNDLSFIEKCAFARAQEQAGYRRETIANSLGTSRSHISEMLQIATILPKDILLRIGPAAEIGRRRWLDFSEKWTANKNSARSFAELQATAAFDALSSQDRFLAALAALLPPATRMQNETSTRNLVLKGIAVGQVNYSRSGTKVSFNKGVSTEFVDFLLNRMDDLHGEFLDRAKT